MPRSESICLVGTASGFCASAVTPLDVLAASVGAGCDGMEREAVVADDAAGFVEGGSLAVNLLADIA